MAAGRRGQVWWALGAAGALAVACTAALIAWPQPERRAYAEARARWEARAFESYRLITQDERCESDVLVRRGRVNAGAIDSCTMRARPIDALFELIARDREVSPVCGTAGCLCELVTRVAASYHPQLGYPTEIVVEATLRPRWTSPETWRALLSTGRAAPCGGGGRSTIRVVTLIPDNR